MKLSIFLIAFIFATLAVEAQCQIINPTVNQEDDDDYKKRQRMQAKRIMQQQRMQRQQMQFMYHQR